MQLDFATLRDKGKVELELELSKKGSVTLDVSWEEGGDVGEENDEESVDGIDLVRPKANLNLNTPSLSTRPTSLTLYPRPITNKHHPQPYPLRRPTPNHTMDAN